MRLYLIQHGEAKSKAEDPERSLTPQGEANARRAGDFFSRWSARHEPTDMVVLHSGKKRAVQTARIVLEAVEGNIPIETHNALAPNDDVTIIQKEIEKTGKEAIVLVGHLPHLSRLASKLLTGNHENETVQFKNAGIVCLAYREEIWTLEWMVTPDIME
ncbi:MAG: phosphohistidine phosphatase SixA [bacterium]|nr:phosphohistidine phosphatase SixA [bacterium]